MAFDLTLMKFDPTTGSPNPYPSQVDQYRAYHGKIAWLYNPFTGKQRTANNIGSDTFGMLIVSEFPLKEEPQKEDKNVMIQEFLKRTPLKFTTMDCRNLDKSTYVESQIQMENDYP